jgi:hypothetical protein
MYHEDAVLEFPESKDRRPTFGRSNALTGGALNSYSGFRN